MISLFLIVLFLWARSSLIPVIPVNSGRWSRAAPLTAPCKASRSRSLTMPACRELMGELPFNALRGSHSVADNNNNYALFGGLNKSHFRLGSYLQTISWNMTRMRFGDVWGFILWVWPKAQFKITVIFHPSIFQHFSPYWGTRGGEAHNTTCSVLMCHRS